MEKLLGGSFVPPMLPENIQHVTPQNQMLSKYCARVCSANMHRSVGHMADERQSSFAM
jgi:hypothetical protein